MFKSILQGRKEFLIPFQIQQFVFHLFVLAFLYLAAGVRVDGQIFIPFAPVPEVGNQRNVVSRC
jgi:hypothetical protein